MFATQLKTLQGLEQSLREFEQQVDTEIKWAAYTDEFEWHVRKRSAIIPIILPGYFDQIRKQHGTVDFSRWWPGCYSSSPIAHVLLILTQLIANIEAVAATEFTHMHSTQIGCKQWRIMHSSLIAAAMKISMPTDQ